MRWTIDSIRGAVVGLDRQVPRLDGVSCPCVNLDNAASTPALKPVLDDVLGFLEWYSSVHRGTGFKSLVSTHTYEACRRRVGEFVGADPDRDVVIFTKHTTESVNLLARRLAAPRGSVVLSSLMEHHANDLPWRAVAREAGLKVEHVWATPEGEYDLEDLEKKLRKNSGQTSLVAVTAASNVTGYLNPVHRIARMAHEAGARVFVDAAQIAAHRPLDMKPFGDPEHLDFTAFSGHKMYAPFGAGALIGPRSAFEAGDPMLVGGGCVKIVGLDRVVWEVPPEKDEAGSPNVVGAVALASACSLLREIGMEQVAEHERHLLRHLLQRLERVPRIVLYARPWRPDEDRVGIATFNIEGVDDFLAAAILGYEGAVAVRPGCFCAHPYVKFLLRVSPEVIRQFEEQVVRGDRSNLPGAVRASLGIYNTREEVDGFVDRLERIARGDHSKDYVQDRATGMYSPRGFAPDLDRFFHLRASRNS